MKLLFTLAFILFVFVQSFAQRQDVDSDAMFYLTKSEKYRKMANTGAVLTVSGGILFIVGIVTIVNAVETNVYGTTTQTTANSKVETGVAAYLLGVAGVGAGIPLWIVGAHSHRKYERKLKHLSIGLNLTPQKQD